MTVLKEIKPLSPAAFFEVRSSFPKIREKISFREGKLPSGTFLTGEGELIEIAALWSAAGLFLEMSSKLAAEEGDYLELFIDTRDLKSSHVVTRFCHHFAIYPVDEKGMEITRFRGEDSREIATATLIAVTTTVRKNSYVSEISLPKEVLYGYDPSEYKRIGFAYRWQRKNGEKQHFPLSSDLFHLTKHPALWATIHLSEEKS